MNPFGHVSQRHLGTRQCPRGLCYVTDPSERSSKASPPLVLCWFASRVKIEWPWIHGSTVIDLEPSSRPWNPLPMQITDIPAMQPPLGSDPSPLEGKAVEPRAGRRPLASFGAQGTTHHLNCYLQVPPLYLHTIKGVVVHGGEVPLFNSKHSNLLQAI